MVHNQDYYLDILQKIWDFDYIKAETKEEYLNNIEYFVDPNLHEKPLIFEVFVNPKDDEFAYNATKRTITSNKAVAKKRWQKSIRK